MPVFNGEQWLRQSINSLLKQTYPNFVLIISDNASTDGTRQICETFAQQDRRIHYYRNPYNIGVFRNYNKVFSLATTSWPEIEYFKWASSNDLCEPQFLEKCLGALEDNPAVVAAYPGTKLFTDDPNYTDDYLHDISVCDESPARRFVRVLADVRLNSAYNGVIRTGALRKSSFNQVYVGSDIVLVAELALQGKILQLPDRLLLRRVKPDAMSALRGAASLQEFFAAEGRDVLASPTWDFHWHCLLSALKAPVSLKNKIRCAIYVAHRFWWSRRDAMREIRLKMRALAYFL